MDPELERISENLKRLAAGKATPAQLEAYLQSEGMSRAQYSASVDVGRIIPQHELAPQFRGGAAGKAEMTAGEMGRVMAAGLLPGFSDEVIGVVAGMLDGNRSIAEATADERNVLASARAKGGSTALEMLTGFATGTGLAKLATKGIPGLSRAASILTGGLGKAAPASTMGGVGQGIKSGATVGAISGAGEAEGNLFDRAIGGLKGAAGGAVIGGTMGGALTAAGNRLAPAQLDPTDAAQAFPLGTPAGAQRQAVGELSDAMRRGGVEVDDARRAAAGMQAGGVSPLLADVGGPSMQGDVSLLDALAQTRGGGASKVFKETLVPREQERATRRVAAVSSANGGRPTASFPEYVDKLKAQKRALDDIMFDRARREASTYVRKSGRFEAPKGLRDALVDPAFVAKVDALEATMNRGRASGRLGPMENFRQIFDVDDEGNRVVRDYLDPITLSNLSRDLGETASKSYKAGENAAGADFANVKNMIDNLLDEIPTFKEANALSKHMHARIQAAEEGYQKALRGKPGAVEQARSKYGKTAPPIPADVRKLLAGPDAPPELAGRNSFGPAWSDYQAGAQSARVDPLLMAKDPTKMSTVVAPSRDAALFGPGASAAIQASDEAEAMAARTAQMSPSAQNRIAPNKGVSPEQRAIEGMSAAVRPAVRFGGGATGFALGGIDAVSRAARFGVPMSPERMTGIARGSMAPATAGLNLIDQIRAASNTPMRRGLLGGTGFATGGLLGDIWSQQ